MEVKIPKEIREYKESMFWGLSLRQCVCSLLAVGVAVALYFLLKEPLGTEQASWICVLGAAPFAACGFFKYHGLSAEQFAWVWIKFVILSPKRLPYQSENFYYDCLFSKQAVAQRRKRK